MAFNPDEFRAGQVLGAAALNAFFAELARLSQIHADAPLTFANDASGVRFAVAVPPSWWIKLTAAGSGGKYAWTRQQPVVGGGWIAHPGGQSGTATDDPAVETTLKADVTINASAIYPAGRDPVTRTVFFTAGNCP